jgi:hypothetical protein
MDFKATTQAININNDEIKRHEIEIKKLSSDVPKMENYTDFDFELYLARNGLSRRDEDFVSFKAHLINQYEKRQEHITSRDFLITLNKVLDNLIEFWQTELRNPTDDELKVLAEGTGTQENIDKSIAYIEENNLNA